MKNIIKILHVFICIIAMICTLGVCVPINASDYSELKWKESVDENGYPIQILDMSEEEIELYQISQLKKKYESNIMQRTGGYSHEYSMVSTLYDTGSSATSYILIGAREQWGQRGSKGFGINVFFRSGL